MIDVICRISSVFQGSFAKETYSFKEPTDGSHPIADDALHTLQHTATHCVSVLHVAVKHFAAQHTNPSVLDYALLFCMYFFS